MKRVLYLTARHSQAPRGVGSALIHGRDSAGQSCDPRTPPCCVTMAAEGGGGKVRFYVDVSFNSLGRTLTRSMYARLAEWHVG